MIANEENSSTCGNIIGVNQTERRETGDQRVNGEAETCSDESEGGDDIDDDESLCDSFYSGKRKLP